MIIDTLTVELGLDPKNFSAGAQAAIDALRKMEQQGLAGGKAIEAQQKRMFDNMVNLRREALTWVGAFLGGRGTLEFVNYLTKLDASTGRLSTTIGENTQEISAWQSVIKGLGGDANSANAALSGLNTALVAAQQSGNVGPVGILGQFGVTQYDNGKLKQASQVYREIAASIERNKMDPREAAGLLRNLGGINEDMINAMVQGGTKLEANLSAGRKAGGATEQSSKQAQDFQKSMGLLETASTNAGRALMEYFYKPLTLIADKLREIIELSPLAAGVLGTAFGVLGGLGIIKGASKLAGRIFGGGAAGAGARAGAGAVGGSLGGSVAGFALGAGTLGAGFYFGSTSEAGATTLTDRWDQPFMGPQGPGGRPSPEQMEEYIRRSAIARGIDPDIAVRVAKSEGLYAYNHSPTGQSFVPGEQSFGPFQLNYSKKGTSLGDRFTRTTGLDARNPATWQHQVDFSLDEAHKGGWGPWHGWKGDPRAGIGRGGAPLGAGAAAFSGSAPAAAGATNTTVTVENVNVNAPSATDAGGISKEIAPKLQLDITAAMGAQAAI